MLIAQVEKEYSYNIWSHMSAHDLLPPTDTFLFPTMVIN